MIHKYMTTLGGDTHTLLNVLKNHEFPIQILVFKKIHG